ncbi:MAG: hypothetical protein ACPGPE_17750, partial [Planctomycetota bacterium]
MNQQSFVRTRSEEIFAAAKALIPGGVNSPVRAYGSVGGVPPHLVRGEGALVWDEDGNEYVDLVGSYGPLILGHGNAEVRAALLAPYGSWSEREQTWRFVADIPMREDHPSWAPLAGIADGLESLRGLPMEIVWGMQDWCFSPLFLAGWEQRFPGAPVTRLDDVGHYVMEDAPQEVLEA